MFAKLAEAVPEKEWVCDGKFEVVATVAFEVPKLVLPWVELAVEIKVLDATLAAAKSFRLVAFHEPASAGSFNRVCKLVDPTEFLIRASIVFEP